MKKTLLVGLITLMIVILTACGGEKDETGKVVISGKKFTEQVILANILGEYLQANTDLEVVMEDSLGSSFVLQEAMIKGDIDMYVEYTGTAFENFFDEELDTNLTQEEVYELVRDKYEEEFNMTWLEPLGFNNTYTLVMRSELYDELDIETYTELKEFAPELSFGGTPEFMERDDGFDGFVEKYGYEDYSDKITLDADLMYRAAQDGEVDIISAFATEAKIDEFNLEPLEDDQSFFPPYDAGIVVREEILDANPELEDELNKLAGTLNDDRMRELNGKVLDDMRPEEVAVEFLEEEGLID